jgi:hypothetical protein
MHGRRRQRDAWTNKARGHGSVYINHGRATLVTIRFVVVTLAVGLRELLLLFLVLTSCVHNMAPLSFRILLLATLALGSPFAPGSPVVDLGYAKYQGTTLTGGVNQFLGMRFAQPPLGSLRWQAPQAPAKERGITPAESVSSPES